MTARTGYRLASDDRRWSIPVDGVREGADGRLVLRLTRKLPNHPAFDPAEDEAYAHIVSGFVAWLEAPDGSVAQLVRLETPKGAELRDVGKWAIAYAIVGAEAVGAERLIESGARSGRE